MKEKKLMNEKFAKNIITCLISLLSICLIVLFFARILTNVSVGAESYSTDIKVELEKYVNFKISDQDKGTLAQYNIKTSIKQEEGKEYSPAKSNELKVSLNQINGKYPYAVKVLAISTELTNGKKEEIKEDYEYNQTAGEVVIKTSNEDEKGEPINSEKPAEDAKDEYIVICYYDTYEETPEEKEIGLKVSLKVVLFEDDKVIDYQNEYKEKVKENISELTSVLYNTDEIYNGYIKSNVINGTTYNTQYTQTQSIVISKKEAQEKLNILEDNTFVRLSKDENNEEVEKDIGNNGKLIYKSTKIKKSDIEKILGEEGKLEILDKNNNVLALIDKDTTFAEDGTVTINYKDEIESIIVKTSEIKNEGILKLENTKEIKSTMVEAKNIEVKTVEKVTGTKEKIEKVNNEDVTTDVETFTNSYENKAEIKDAQLDVNFTVSNTKWTNAQQNEVTFEALINANSTNKNMLKDSMVKIELPSEVEKVILGESSVMYSNGLKLQKPVLEKTSKGNIVICAKLLGTQNEYNENDLGLVTDIKIPASIILNKDMDNKDSNIKYTYTNKFTLDGKEEGITKEDTIQLESYNSQTVESNNSVLTTTPLNTQSMVQTVNVEGLKMEVEPVRGDTVLKEGDTVYEGEFIKYNIKVTNTSNQKMDNVKVIGTIPEGTVYAELDADYHSIWGKYEYKYDENIKEKEINIGSLEAGKSTTVFYEVKVNNLEEGKTENSLISNIKLYINSNQASNYELNNVVKNSDINLFMTAELNGIEDTGWNYFVKITSKQDKNTEVKVKLPEIFGVDTIKYAKEEGSIQGTNISEDNLVTIPVELKANETKEILIDGIMDSKKITNKTEESEIELKSYATIEENDKIYKSNENRILFGYDNISIVMSSDNEGEDVKEESEIKYKITLKNIGKSNLPGKYTYFRLTDYLPEKLNPKTLSYEYWEEDKEYIDEENGIFTGKGTFSKKKQEQSIQGYILDENNEKMPSVDIYFTIPYGESVNIEVTAEADYVAQKTKIENSAYITGSTIDSKQSNIITHNIIPADYEIDDGNNGNDNDNKGNEDNNTGNEDNGSDITEKHSISGVAWVDKNEDGKRQDDEQLLSGITVMLVDIENANKIKEEQVTDENGKYSFANLESGKYIVIFKYDSDNYTLTQYKVANASSDYNSDFVQKEIGINGVKTKVAVTDILSVNANIANIDMGLIKNKICDLRLDKYISKVTVKTSNDVKEYTYDKKNLAKVEVKAKEINGATLVVEYKIVVTNEGELETTASKIVDYLPEGLDFSTELNNSWIKTKDGKVYNTSLANKAIKPGESAEVTLIATVNLTENATGTYTNIAEIAEISNSLNAKDVDSTPNNNVNTEDDYSKAELIVSISTGKELIYIGITIICLILFGIGIKFVKNKNFRIVMIMLMLIIGVGGCTLRSEAEKSPEDMTIINSIMPKELYMKNNGESWDTEPTFTVWKDKNTKLSELAYCINHSYAAYADGRQKFVRYYAEIKKSEILNTEGKQELELSKVKGQEKITDINSDVTIELNKEYKASDIKLMYEIYANGEKKIGELTGFTQDEKKVTFKVGNIDGIDDADKIKVIVKINGTVIGKRNVEVTGWYVPDNYFLDGFQKWESAEAASEDHTQEDKYNSAGNYFKYRGNLYQKTKIVLKGTIENEIEQPIQAEISWKIQRGYSKIIKTDNNGESLSGAVFGLYPNKNCNDNEIIKITAGEKEGEYSIGGNEEEMLVDSSGKILISGLKLNEDYWIKEIKAPSGYMADENAHKIKVCSNITDADKEENTTEIKNTPIGILKILKYDEDNKEKKLSNAKFRVYDNVGNLIKATNDNGNEGMYVYCGDGTLTSGEYNEFTTNENGIIQIRNLPIGTYTIKEIKAPNGYSNDNKKYQVSVKQVKNKVGNEWRQKIVNVLNGYIDIGDNKTRIQDRYDSLSQSFSYDGPISENDSKYVFDEEKNLFKMLFTLNTPHSICKYLNNGSEESNELNLDKFFQEEDADGQCKDVADKDWLEKNIFSVSSFEEDSKFAYKEKLGIFVNYLGESFRRDLEIDEIDVRILAKLMNEINDVTTDPKTLKTYYKYALLLYDEKDNDELNSLVDKTRGITVVEVPNKGTINLKGYVWKELENMSPNGKYDMNKKENFLKGVTVKLVDNNGNTVKNKEGKECSIETGLDGAYIFKNVERENLSNYHLETSYNGMSYQATNTDYKTASLKNGNVFSEIKRDEFNEKFTTIELNRAIGNNNDVTALEYSNDAPNVSKLKLNEGKNITIDSLPVTGVEGKYTINAKSENIYIDKNNKSSIGYYDGKDTISGLNLGVYVREMPDIELEMNVVSVTISVNGRRHTYNNAINKKDFENLTVYNADFENDDFKIDITYNISLKDSSTVYYTNLNTKINQVNIVPIIGDKKFNTIEMKGFVGSVIPKKAINNNTSTTVVGTNTLSFEKADLNEKGCSIDDLNNITAYAEVVSYSTENGANVYGGVDKDSQPGNLDISRQNTYEDDSDNANVNCEKGIRTISGIVFEDNATGEIGAGKQRLGNGQYDENENKIKDVKVQLQIIKEGNYNKSETIEGYKTIDATTNADGTFEITDFVAGRYKLVYTWGNDSKYNVVDYKSTIWSEKNRESKNNDGKWYTKTEPRYSDALDDWYTRKKIDYDNSTEKPTTMDATTNDMEVGINDGKIENIDFGLIERPRQKVDIEKVVSSVKLSLANNAPIVEADVIEKEDGKRGFKEDVKGVQYIEPTKELPEGQILLTVDNELLQGSTLEINYSIKLSNSSEVDYNNENYYKYGEKDSDDELVKLKIKSIYDYLDKIMPLASDNKWKVCTSEYNKDENKETYAQANAAIKRWWDTQTTEDGTKIENSGYEMMQSHYFSELTEWNDSTEQELRKTISNSRQTLKYNIDNISLEPGKILETPLTLSTSKKLANTSEEIVIKNDTEVTKVIRENNYGRMVRLEQGKSFDSGEEVKIIPPTGQDKAYIVPTTVAIVSLGILLGGIILIKKKVLE